MKLRNKQYDTVTLVKDTHSSRAKGPDSAVQPCVKSSDSVHFTSNLGQVNTQAGLGGDEIEHDFSSFSSTDKFLVKRDSDNSVNDVLVKKPLQMQLNASQNLNSVSGENITQGYIEYGPENRECKGLKCVYNRGLTCKHRHKLDIEQSYTLGKPNSGGLVKSNTTEMSILNSATVNSVKKRGHDTQGSCQEQMSSANVQQKMTDLVA